MTKSKIIPFRVTTDEFEFLEKAAGGKSHVSKFIRNQLFAKPSVNSAKPPPPAKVQTTRINPAVHCDNARCHRLGKCTCIPA